MDLGLDAKMVDIRKGSESTGEDRWILGPHLGMALGFYF